MKQAMLLIMFRKLQRMLRRRIGFHGAKQRI